MVTRPINPQLLSSRLYGRAAVGAVLPNFNQSLYARIAAQRAAFLQSQPQTLYDPGLNPVVAERIRNQYGFNDQDWKAMTQTIGGVIGTGLGAKSGWAVGTTVGLGIGAKFAGAGAAAGTAILPGVGTMIGAVVAGTIGAAIGAITGAQTGAAIGGMASPSGLIATGELLRNTVINIGQNPVTGLAVAGVTLGSQFLVGKYLPGLTGMSRIAVSNALTRVGTQAYLGFGQMISDQDTTMEPNSAMSSLAAVANTLDNYSGASTIKAGLAAMTGDEEDFMTILSKAYGWNEEGFTQLDFSRIRQNLKADFGTFGNAAIDFVGEMLVDPGIWYSQMRGTAERHIYQRTRSVLAAEQVGSIKVLDGKTVIPDSNWGKFIQSLDRAGFHRMSRVITEYMFEQSKNGRVVNAISKKKTGKAYSMFKDEIIKTSITNKNMGELIKQNAKDIDGFLKPIFDEMVAKVLDTTDNSILNKAIMAQQSTDEVKSIFDVIMNDPAIKNKGKAIDMNLYSDLKRFKPQISMSDFNRIKAVYPTIRVMDDIDNFIGMTSMTLMNPAMAGARLGSYKLSNLISRGRADRSFDVNSVLEVNKDGKIVRSKNYRNTIKTLQEQRKLLMDNKQQLKEEIRAEMDQQRITELNETADRYDKEIERINQEYKTLQENFKAKKELYQVILWEESGLSAQYGMYDEDSIKPLEDKLKEMDPKDPGYEKLKETIESFKETKILLDAHNLEIDILNDVLKEVQHLEALHKMYGDQFDLKYTRGKNHTLVIGSEGNKRRVTANQAGRLYSMEKEKALINNNRFIKQVEYVNDRIGTLIELLKNSRTEINSDIKEQLLQRLESNYIFTQYSSTRLAIRRMEMELFEMNPNDKGYLELAAKIEEAKGNDPLEFLRRRNNFTAENEKVFLEAETQIKGVGRYTDRIKAADPFLISGQSKIKSKNEKVQFDTMLRALGISKKSSLYKILYSAVFQDGGAPTIGKRQVSLENVLQRYFDSGEETKIVDLFDYDTFMKVYKRLESYEALLKSKDKYAKDLDEIRLSDSEDLKDFDMTYQEFKELTDTIVRFQKVDEDGTPLTDKDGDPIFEEGKPTSVEQIAAQVDSKITEYFISSKVYILDPSKKMERDAREVSLLDFISSPENMSKLSIYDQKIVRRFKEQKIFQTGTHDISTELKGKLKELIRIKDILKQEYPTLQLNKQKTMVDMVTSTKYKDIYDISIQMLNALSGKGQVGDYSESYRHIFMKAAGGAFEGNKKVEYLRKDLQNFVNSVSIVNEISKHHTSDIKGVYEALDILRSRTLNVNDIFRVNEEGSYVFNKQDIERILSEKTQALYNSTRKYNIEEVDFVINLIKQFHKDKSMAGFEFKEYNRNLSNDTINVYKEIFDLTKQEFYDENNKPYPDQDIHNINKVEKDMREHFLYMTSALRSTLGYNKAINNVLDRVILGTDVSRRMQAFGINYSEIGKEGYILTLKTPLTLRNDSKFKKLYGNAWMSKREYENDPRYLEILDEMRNLDPESSEYKLLVEEFEELKGEFMSKDVYGVDKDNRSEALDTIIKVYQQTFPEDTDADFLMISHLMQRAKLYGLRNHEIKLGRYYYHEKVKGEMDGSMADFYTVLKQYNRDLRASDLEAVVGLAKYYAENSVSSKKVMSDFENFSEGAELDMGILKDKDLPSYKYTEELQQVSKLLNDIPLEVIRERGRDFGIELSDEMINRIEDLRNPDSNIESRAILQRDILKEIIKSKDPEAYEMVSIESQLSKQNYALKMNGPQDGQVHIKMGNKVAIYKKTGIKAESFPNHSRIVVFDEETTGLKPSEEGSAIVEHGSQLLEVIDGEFVATRQLNMLNKLKNLSKETTDLTKITQKDLDKYGIDEAELAKEIYELIKDESTLLVAYNAGFDIAFVNMLLKKHIPGFKRITNDILDPMTMYQDKFMYSSRLETAGYRLGGEGENTHRATDDAALTTSVLQKLINGGQNPIPYINRLGFDERYKDQLERLKGVQYVAQDKYSEDGRNVIGTRKSRVRSTSPQVQLNRKDYIDQVDKEVQEYIKLHGKEEIEVAKNAYTESRYVTEIAELREKKKEALQAINDKYKYDEELGYFAENKRVDRVKEKAIELMVNRDEAGFKKLIRLFMEKFVPEAPADKAADNLWALYEDMVISKEALDNVLEPYTSNKVVYYDDALGKYRTVYTLNPEDYVDVAMKKPFAEMNETELKYYRESVTKKYMTQTLLQELRRAEQKGEWIPAQNEKLAALDSQIKLINDQIQDTTKDTMGYVISKLDQFYNMKIDDLKIYFTDKNGIINYDEFFRFFKDNPDFKFIVSYESDEIRTRSVIDPESLTEVAPGENPNVRQAIITSADDIKALVEMGEGLQMGIMSVEHFKKARTLTNEPYKLPAPLDFYYRNILRLQKKDMLLRFSFHPRNFIDVIRKNSTILSDVWQTKDFIQQGAKAYSLYHKWDSYQKEIVQYMNGLHKLYAKGATPEDITKVKTDLKKRSTYLENEIKKGTNEYQKKKDIEQLDTVKKLMANFDEKGTEEAIKLLYQHYDTLGFGAYIRQHHNRNYTVADYLNGKVDNDTKDIDTYVYRKLQKNKKFRQASLEEQEIMFREAIEDEITMLDMTNIFEKTSATTDINSFIKSLNKKDIEGERLPLGDRVFQTLASDNWFSKKYMGIGTEIEQVGRLHGYLLDRHLYGQSHDEAVSRSLKRHYDYSDQSPAEVWATMIFPFHAFPTRNAMFWAGIFQDASQIRTMHNLITALWGSVDEEDKDSNYIQNAMINGYVPVGNTLIKLGDSRASAYGLFLNPGQEATGRLNPLIREAVNQLNGGGYKGIDLLRNIPIARFAPETLAALDRRRSGAGIHQTVAPSMFGTMYRFDTDGRYRAKYENIYRNLYTAKGKQRTPSRDAYYRVRSIMYDIKRRQYAR